MSTELTVRPVVDADFAAWKPLWDGYNAFYETRIPDDVTRATWARFLDPAMPVHALVAERAGRIVGLVHYLYHLSTTTLAPSCYLRDLFTIPEARTTGVGGRLIEAVYAAARDAKAARVYWLTHRTNATARRLYDRVAEDSGFVVYEKNL